MFLPSSVCKMSVVCCMSVMPRMSVDILVSWAAEQAARGQKTAGTRSFAKRLVGELQLVSRLASLLAVVGQSGCFPLYALWQSSKVSDVLEAEVSGA